MKPEIISAALKNERGPFFLGLPERWLDNPTYRCANGHVVSWYIKSEELGRPACPSCKGQIWTTFPEDYEYPNPETPKTNNQYTI